MDTYKSTNTLNGRFYIGSTTNFEKRKKEHLNSTCNFPFQRALRANPEVFEWEVWTDESKNRELEQALLDMWFGTEQCYNLSPYANGGSGFVCQDYTWITNKVDEKLLPPGEDVPEGWEAGRLPFSPEAKKKKSLRNLEWEKNPFRKTGEESMSHGRKWVTTPEKDREKYLKPGEEAPEGWISGRMKRPPRSAESRERTRQALKGKPKSDSHKQSLREATLNYHANKGKT
jgi:hypothetical protein